MRCILSHFWQNCKQGEKYAAADYYDLPENARAELWIGLEEWDIILCKNFK
jgi:hypothetical protein